MKNGAEEDLNSELPNLIIPDWSGAEEDLNSQLPNLIMPNSNINLITRNKSNNNFKNV